MLPVETLAVFAAATFALAITPGPDNIFVLTQSAIYGRSAGLLVTFGLCTGVFAHTAAVALGVAAIFASSALAFNLLKLLGAGYLLYLAWGAWRAKPLDVSAGSGVAGAGWRLYLRGVVMNITNPKVAIFFLAFLPQFADPEQGSVPLQILVLGFLFSVSTIVVFGAVAVFAARIGDWLRRSDRAQTVMNRVAALVFVALAARLATAGR